MNSTPLNLTKNIIWDYCNDGKTDKDDVLNGVQDWFATVRHHSAREKGLEAVILEDCLWEWDIVHVHKRRTILSKLITEELSLLDSYFRNHAAEFERQQSRTSDVFTKTASIILSGLPKAAGNIVVIAPSQVEPMEELAKHVNKTGHRLFVLFYDQDSFARVKKRLPSMLRPCLTRVRVDLSGGALHRAAKMFAEARFEGFKRGISLVRRITGLYERELVRPWTPLLPQVKDVGYVISSRNFTQVFQGLHGYVVERFQQLTGGFEPRGYLASLIAPEFTKRGAQGLEGPGPLTEAVDRISVRYARVGNALAVHLEQRHIKQLFAMGTQHYISDGVKMVSADGSSEVDSSTVALIRQGLVKPREYDVTWSLTDRVFTVKVFTGTARDTTTSPVS